MTGYQETLTDPSLPPPGRRDDRAARRQHRRQRRGRRVRAGSGSPATSCATPPAAPSNWRSTRGRSTTSSRDQGVVGICGIDTRALTRHLRERGAMRVGIFSGDAADRPASELLDAVRASPQMAGADLAERGHHRRGRTSSRPVGEKRFTVAAVDLGIKAMTPQLMAERGIEVHVLPATATARGRAARVEPRRRVLLQRPRRPGHRRRTRSTLLRAVLDARHAATSASASATSSSAGRSASAPTS